MNNKKSEYQEPSIKILKFGCDEASPAPADTLVTSGGLTDTINGTKAYSAGQQSWTNIYGN